MAKKNNKEATPIENVVGYFDVTAGYDTPEVNPHLIDLTVQQKRWFPNDLPTDNPDVIQMQKNAQQVLRNVYDYFSISNPVVLPVEAYYVHAVSSSDYVMLWCRAGTFEGRVSLNIPAPGLEPAGGYTLYSVFDERPLVTAKSASDGPITFNAKL